MPEIMRQEGFDMWLVICRENTEDPVFELVPFTSLYATRRPSWSSSTGAPRVWSGWP